MQLGDSFGLDKKGLGGLQSGGCCACVRDVLDDTSESRRQPGFLGNIDRLEAERLHAARGPKELEFLFAGSDFRATARSGCVFTAALNGPPQEIVDARRSVFTLLQYPKQTHRATEAGCVEVSFPQSKLSKIQGPIQKRSGIPRLDANRPNPGNVAEKDVEAGIRWRFRRCRRRRDPARPTGNMQ